MRMLLLFACVLFGITAGAQDYKKTLTDGKEWKCYLKGNEFDGVDRIFTVTVLGDTVVDGRECKRVHVQYYTTEMQKFNDFYKGAYEENGKVYATGMGEEGFSLLLDYGLHKGDGAGKFSVSIDDEVPDTYVQDVDTIEVRGCKYRRLKLSKTYFGDNVYWVDGIGANYDSWYTVFPAHNSDYSYMLECYDNGKLIFAKDDFAKAPVVNGIRQATVSDECEGRKYDLSGRSITVPQRGSVYIENSEKHIAR